MIEQKLPIEIDYPFIVPKGFPSIYKQWEVDPMSSNKQWANNDIVRFNFMNLGKGVFDPYRSYIEITVSTNPTNNPVGCLQIDNSAQSFVNQMVLYSNSRQIQRITQYDVLAAYLNDIGLNQMISEGRQAQGLGYGSFDTMPFGKNTGVASSVPRNCVGANQATLTSSSSNLFPTIGNYYPQQSQYQNAQAITNASRVAKGHVTNANVILANTDANGGNLYTSQPALKAALMLTGYANNIRSQYNAKFVQNKFPEATWSIPNYQLQLSQTLSGSNGTYPIVYSSSTPYYTQVRNAYPASLTFQSGVSTFNNHTINTANFGFSSLFCPFYTRGTFQPMISATIPQCSVFNGGYQTTKLAVYRRKFKLPVISATMGVLIDPAHFKLIPLASINQAMMEITLCPHAMFTSGYSDYCEIDTKGMSQMQSRNYTIQRISYKLQTYHFIDEDVNQYIQSSLVKQITIPTNFWALANQYQIPGGNGVSSSWIVGCNSTHLNQIVCLFVPNDYQSYSFARKHFRLSNNIKKFWSKIGVDYWPPQPFKGNGGNVCSNNIDDDNSMFVQNIYWNNNYMFSKSTLPRINPYNFAVNNRPYNIANKNTFYDPNMVGNHNYVFTGNSVNADTAMGMSWIHENRVVGKAAYLISYTPFKQTQNVLQGINVSSISNFEVIFDSDTNSAFQRDQTLYIFSRSSGVVKYGKNGIKTFGRG